MINRLGHSALLVRVWVPETVPYLLPTKAGSQVIVGQFVTQLEPQVHQEVGNTINTCAEKQT